MNNLTKQEIENTVVQQFPSIDTIHRMTLHELVDLHEHIRDYLKVVDVAITQHLMK